MKAIEVLPGYRPVAPGVPGEEAILAYERDGVVCLRGAFDNEWVLRGRRAVAAALCTRARSREHARHRKGEESGVFFFDTFLWKRLPSFRRFTFESPAAALALIDPLFRHGDRQGAGHQRAHPLALR